MDARGLAHSNQLAIDRQMQKNMMDLAKKQLECLEKHEKIPQSNENKTNNQSRRRGSLARSWRGFEKQTNNETII